MAQLVCGATLLLSMHRMGAIMASGLLDAGGRNATMGLKSRSGYFRRTAVVGLAVFVQYWWAPLGCCVLAILSASAQQAAPALYRVS
jgi:26S proteasome regulatory subunit N2